MLLANQRLDKLAACCTYFSTCNMLDGPCLAPGVIPVLLLPLLPPLLMDDPDDMAVNEARANMKALLARTQGKSHSNLLKFIQSNAGFLL